jgi:hypothetical protein
VEQGHAVDQGITISKGAGKEAHCVNSQSNAESDPCIEHPNDRSDRNRNCDSISSQSPGHDINYHFRYADSEPNKKLGRWNAISYSGAYIYFNPSWIAIPNSHSNNTHWNAISNINKITHCNTISDIISDMGANSNSNTNKITH